MDKSVQTEGWTSRVIGRRQPTAIEKEERSTQTDLNIEVLESMAQDLHLDPMKRPKLEEKKSSGGHIAILIDQSTQTKAQEPESSKQEKGVEESAKTQPKDEGSQTAEELKRLRIVKKKRSIRDASVQTSVSTTVSSPAIRRPSRSAPLLIAREEATQTLDERRLLRDASSQTGDLH